MDVRRSLFGIAIGTLAGVGAQVAIEGIGHWEASWAPLLIGLLVGVGARKADVSSSSGVSYVRGALAAAVALGAIVVGPYLVARVRAAFSPRVLTHSAPKVTHGEEADDVAPASTGDADDSSSKALEANGQPGMEDVQRGPLDDAVSLAHRPDQFSVWQFVFMAVGTLLAYELARGTEVRYEAPEADEPDEGDNDVDDADLGVSATDEDPAK